MGQIRHTGRNILGHFRLICPLVVTALLLLPVFATAGEKFSEYKLKAAYIYNFGKFIEWPDAITNQQKMIICVDASMDIYKILLKELHLKRINNRTIDLLNVTSNNDIKSCSVLFSGLDAKTGMHVNDGLLTIGESQEFLQQGGMIRFFKEEGKLRFEINPRQAKAHHITISSKLLRLAKIIYVKTTNVEIHQ